MKGRYIKMKEFFYLLLGAAIGAIIALLFAPESGQELRANLRATADKDLGRLQSELRTLTDKTFERMDQMQADLDTAVSQMQSEEADAG
jgi:gas vesicle protein